MPISRPASQDERVSREPAGGGAGADAHRPSRLGLPYFPLAGTSAQLPAPALRQPPRPPPPGSLPEFLPPRSPLAWNNPGVGSGAVPQGGSCERGTCWRGRRQRCGGWQREPLPLPCGPVGRPSAATPGWAKEQRWGALAAEATSSTLTGDLPGRAAADSEQVLCWVGWGRRPLPPAQASPPPPPPAGSSSRAQACREGLLRGREGGREPLWGRAGGLCLPGARHFPPSKQDGSDWQGRAGAPLISVAMLGLSCLAGSLPAAGGRAAEERGCCGCPSPRAAPRAGPDQSRFQAAALGL